jgi:hypothetical protein
MRFALFVVLGGLLALRWRWRRDCTCRPCRGMRRWSLAAGSARLRCLRIICGRRAGQRATKATTSRSGSICASTDSCSTVHSGARRAGLALSKNPERLSQDAGLKASSTRRRRPEGQPYSCRADLLGRPLANIGQRRAGEPGRQRQVPRKCLKRMRSSASICTIGMPAPCVAMGSNSSRATRHSV